MKKVICINDEASMLDLGRALAQGIKNNKIARLLFYLNGELGAGKTTLSRALIQSLGYHDRVKSPTYALVEPYQLADCMLYHIDLYRLSDPREIEYLGLTDYLSADAICIIEWPEKGAPYLPEASLCCTIELLPDGNRVCQFKSENLAGDTLLKSLA